MNVSAPAVCGAPLSIPQNTLCSSGLGRTVTAGASVIRFFGLGRLAGSSTEVLLTVVQEKVRHSSSS